MLHIPMSSVSLLPEEDPISFRMFCNFGWCIERHKFRGWGSATSWGSIGYMSSELLGHDKLSMAKVAFTLVIPFLRRCCAKRVDSNFYCFVTMFCLGVGPFFAWVVVGSFRVFGFVVGFGFGLVFGLAYTRDAAMKCWLAFEACQEGGGQTHYSVNVSNRHHSFDLSNKREICYQTQISKFRSSLFFQKTHSSTTQTTFFIAMDPISRLFFRSWQWIWGTCACVFEFQTSACRKQDWFRRRPRQCPSA